MACRFIDIVGGKAISTAKCHDTFFVMSWHVLASREIREATGSMVCQTKVP